MVIKLLYFCYTIQHIILSIDKRLHLSRIFTNSTAIVMIACVIKKGEFLGILCENFNKNVIRGRYHRPLVHPIDKFIIYNEQYILLAFFFCSSIDDFDSFLASDEIVQ